MPFAVFQNYTRNIVLAEVGGPEETHVEFLINTGSEVTFNKERRADFLRDFSELVEYPVERAARIFLNNRAFVPATGRALATLNTLAAIPAASSKEAIMASSKNRKKSALKTTAAPEPAAKKAPAKPAPKPAPAKKDAKKAEPAKKPAAAAPKKEEAKKAPAKAETKPAAKKAKDSDKREHIPGELKITVLATENPHREGTLAHKTFALYKKSKTVADFRENCAEVEADANYLHYHVNRGHVKLS